MLNINLAIKFGSNEIIFYRKGYGIVAKEPAYLAVVEKGRRIKVKASGKEAEKLFYSKSNDITVYQPIQNSTIVNEKMAIRLMSELLKRLIKDGLYSKLTALVAVPCGLSAEELITIKKVLHASGIDRVSFVRNAVCAIENLEIDPSKHTMVVDIGKYITDISILSRTDYLQGKMYYIGGEDMDKSITTFIQDNHELLVSDQTGEAIKNEVASLYEQDMCKTSYVGINKFDKFVKQEINANEVRVAISHVYDSIVSLVNEMLSGLDKEVLAEINDTGILFVGGGSMIAGLFEYLSARISVPINIADNPTDYVILGAGKLLSSKDYIKVVL